MINWIKNLIADVSHTKIAMLFFVLGTTVSILAYFFFSTEMAKIANKLVNLALLNSVWVLYKLLFKNKEFKNDAEISKEPVAVAIDNGMYLLSNAVCLTLGF